MMLRNMIVGLLLWCASFAGAQNALPPIKWRTLAEGHQSNATQFEHHILISQGDLETFLRRMTPSPMKSSLRVDWNKELVLVVHAGRKNTGGHKVYVETIDRTTAAVAMVRVVNVKPNPRDPVTEALTSPWVMIAVERPGNIEWQFSTRSMTANSVRKLCWCDCGHCGCAKSRRQLFQTGRGTTINGQYIGLIPFETFERGAHSDLRRPRHFVLQSEDDYRSYLDDAFGAHRGGRNSDVDWRRHQLVAIHLGSALPGHRAEVESISRGANGVITIAVVDIGPKRPGRGSSLSPYVIVEMPRTNDRIVYAQSPVYTDDPCACGCPCDRYRR